MGTRVKKAVASLAIVIFVVVYAVTAAAIGRSLPEIWWLKLIFYAVAGVAWGVPILPAIRWANREDGSD